MRLVFKQIKPICFRNNRRGGDKSHALNRTNVVDSLLDIGVGGNRFFNQFFDFFNLFVEKFEYCLCAFDT